MSKKKRVARKRALPSRIPIPGQRFGSIPQACNYGGFGRSKLYDLAARNPGLMRKLDAKSVIDFSVLDRILDALPPASISAT